jgi:hypothetical protein
MDLSTDVEIAGVKYQIGRFKARDGSWILAQILTKMLPTMIEGALAKSGAKLAADCSNLSEEEFSSIQGHALAVCWRYENGAPMPVFVLPNTWAVKELEYDLVTVMMLTIHALVFNLSSFFEGDGLNKILGSIPAGPDFVAYPNLDHYAFRPVLAGLWRHAELFDGTYTLEDLFDAHELLDVREENDRRMKAHYESKK